MLLLLILFVFPLLFSFLHRKQRRNGEMHLPPGPPRLPFIGNFHQLHKSVLHRCLRQLSKQYGPLMYLSLGSVPTLVVSSARMAEEVMKTHDLVFSSRPSLLGFQKISYDGLDLAFAPYSAYWREMRKICVIHLFSSRRVLGFRSIREGEVLRMIQNISNFACASKLINLSETLLCLTSTLICKVAFGKSYDDGGYERSRFHGLLGEAMAALGGFYFSDHFPVIGWIDRLTGMMGRLENTCKKLDLFCQEIIDEHLDPNRPKPEREDITDVLLRLHRDHLFSFDLTLDHIKALLTDIFVAGTETSSITLVWAMIALMKNPGVMKKAQEEIRNVIGNKGFVDEDNLEKLPYLKALVKETLGLYPPAPLLLPRETREGCNINGYDIPPKTLVFVNAWAIGRDPKSWENPEEFEPERFLGTSIDFKGQNYELIPFGAGRRICPGMALGGVTVELTLANLLYSFEWVIPGGMKKEEIDMDIQPGLALHKKNPLCLMATKFI